MAITLGNTSISISLYTSMVRWSSMRLGSLKAARVAVSNVYMYTLGRNALQSSPHNFPRVMTVICHLHHSGSCCLEEHGSLTPVTGKHVLWCGVSQTFFHGSDRPLPFFTQNQPARYFHLLKKESTVL